jgi:hypothetical protein
MNRAIARALLLLLAVLTAATVARADKIGDWHIGFGQGNLEHILRNGPGNEFNISCDTGNKGYGVSIFMRIRDRPPPPNSTVRAVTADDEYQIVTGSDGVGEINCRACASNFEALWESLKSSEVLTLIFADDRSVTFKARGGRAALSTKGCKIWTP